MKRNRRKQMPQRFAAVSALLARARSWLIALALFVATGGALLWALERLSDPLAFPVRLVRIEGDFHYLRRGRLERAVAPQVRAGFFAVDVSAVRQAAKSLPWVDEVRIRRVWPDTVWLEVKEQVPLAYWGQERLINVRGELFKPEAKALPPGLPRLIGPQGTVKTLARAYRKMSAVLGPQGIAIDRLELDARRAWRLRLRDGLLVELGKTELDLRLRRLARLYPRLNELHAGKPERVDLRYANGFAVGWSRVSQALGDAQTVSRIFARGAAANPGGGLT